MRRALLASCLASVAAAAGCGGDPAPSTPCPPWTSADAGGCRERGWQLPAAGDGVGDPGARSLSLSLAVDGAGRGLAAWEIAANGTRVVVAEEAEAGWTLREPGAALPGAEGAPSVAAGTEGAAVVAFRHGAAGATAIFASERSPGGTWADPVGDGDRLSSIETAYEPRVAIGRDGEAVLVWNQRLEQEYRVAVARRPEPGAPWEIHAGEEDVISPKKLFSNAPQIALGPAGEGLATWYQSDGGPLMVYASERAAGADAFARPSLGDFLSAPGAPVDSHPVANPRPAIGPRGEAAIVWTQENGAGSNPVYLATREPGGPWTRPAGLEDSFSDPASVARCPQLAFAPSGALWITWFADEGGGFRARLAQRAPDGAWLHPGRAPLQLSSPDAVEAVTPALASGPDDALLVAWAERSADRWRIAARRGASSTVGPIEILSPPGADAIGPAVAIGTAGHALVAWAQGAFGEETIFVARTSSR